MAYGADPVRFESVSATTTTPSVQLGTMVFADGEYYEYVHAAKEITAGRGAVYSGTSGHTVVSTGAVSGEFCAGFVKHATIASGSYGWILKKGVIDVVNGRASTAPSVNQPAYFGSDGTFVSDTGTITSAVDNGHVIGKVLSAGASGGTGASASLLYVNVM